MVDVPESQVINIFIIHVKQQLQKYVLLQAEAGVQLIVYADQHGGENQVIACFILLLGSSSEKQKKIGLFDLKAVSFFLLLPGSSSFY